MTENALKGSSKPMASPANRTSKITMKGFYLLPCIALVLQGCGKSPTDDWLVGGWMPAEESCDSGGGYIFERTGQWRTEGQEGTWKLNGSDLTINVTGTYDDSYELKPSKEVYAYHITEFDKNGFATSASGKIPAIKWKRCSFDLDQTPPAPEGQPASPAPVSAPAMPFFNSGVSCDGEAAKSALYQTVKGLKENKLKASLLTRDPLWLSKLTTYSLYKSRGTVPTDAAALAKYREIEGLMEAAQNAEYTVSDIRVQSHDDKLDNETCAANLTIDAHQYGTATAPITMKVERTTEGSIYVTVSGLEDDRR